MIFAKIFKKMPKLCVFMRICRNIMTFAAMVLGVVSCHKEASLPTEKLVYVRVEASTPDDTKTSLDGLRVDFNPGDVIGVAERSTGATIYPLTTVSGGHKAVFEGYLPEGFTKGRAVYPYTGEEKCSSADNFHVTTPHGVQTGVPGGIADGGSTMWARFDNISDGMLFHHANALLRLDVAGSSVAGITISTGAPANDTKLQGFLAIVDGRAANLSTASGVSSISKSDGGLREISLVPESELFTPGTYYVPILATAVNERVLGGLAVTYTMADGTTYSKQSDRQFKVEQGKIYNLNLDEQPLEDIVGKTMTPWQQGELDIHFIASWTGESIFMVMPDGTRMIIDAASDISTDNNPLVRARYEALIPGYTTSIRGSQIISDYITHFMAPTGRTGIDYALISHFHNDHMGSYLSTDRGGFITTKHPYDYKGSWTINGITEIMENFEVGKLVDRAYDADPAKAYTYPGLLYRKNQYTCPGYSGAEITPNGFMSIPMMTNYRKMVNSIVKYGWSSVERFDVGSDSQFAPLYDASYGVKVRNLGAGGDIWTGSGTSHNMTFPNPVTTFNEGSDQNGYPCPEENHESCGIKLSWGPFSFASLGDSTYDDYRNFSWKNMELPLSQVIGQCEILKANHHGLDNANSAALLKAANPRVWVVSNWNDSQGDIGPVSRLPQGTKMYFTNMTSTIASELSTYMGRVPSYDGHIVVRVYDGGRYYVVYMLNSCDPDYKVKYQSGKIFCR